MQSRIARFLRLSLLLALLVISAAAQATPTVIIRPEAGEVERAVFAIEIDGLLPDTRYSVEIVFQGAVVFGSEENSDQAGPYLLSNQQHRGRSARRLYAACAP